MSFAPTSPITGGAQTGFTSPTYTIAADAAPDQNGKQYAVTALGGTQAGVDITSVSRPFTLTFWRPKVLAVVPKPDVNGVLRANPINKWSAMTRKGVTPLAGQNSQLMTIDSKINIPAGADTADPANIRAAISAHIGLLNQVSAGIGDTVVTGIV